MKEKPRAVWHIWGDRTTTSGTELRIYFREDWEYSKVAELYNANQYPWRVLWYRNLGAEGWANSVEEGMLMIQLWAQAEGIIIEDPIWGGVAP